MLITFAGAFIYHFRRIFHDWSDRVAIEILQNTVPAMSSWSRLWIVDTVVPEINAPWQIALQDINMMSFGGMERSRSQWEILLRKAGLRITRIWTSDLAVHSVIEAVPIERQ